MLHLLSQRITNSSKARKLSNQWLKDQPENPSKSNIFYLNRREKKRKKERKRKCRQTEKGKSMRWWWYAALNVKLWDTTKKSWTKRKDEAHYQNEMSGWNMYTPGGRSQHSTFDQLMGFRSKIKHVVSHQTF